ncbi:PIN domain-containing protein [Caldicellulosiruptor changbaiensis]|uniref:PIN domain-containing protein n=1 Tax=Caldicellulosiruptor changbaiensis TaxID=1222016 RepID=A0A3T0D6L0_9FIRM|nr:PIN domain-containing protein [Caldicellulosiruptor changbaiensis]AZT90636.1 PIN domain-containing protein [Caldicellulosiruptor changbaiensis]
MKVLIDTNVILDVLLKRSPFDVDSYKVLKFCEQNIVEGYIASFAVTDIYYFISKNLGNEKARQGIEALLGIVKLVSINKKDVEDALKNSAIKDLEDALQLRCAKKIRAEWLITRDDKFKKLTSRAITPFDFVHKIIKQ